MSSQLKGSTGAVSHPDQHNYFHARPSARGLGRAASLDHGIRCLPKKIPSFPSENFAPKVVAGFSMGFYKFYPSATDLSSRRCCPCADRASHVRDQNRGTPHVYALQSHRHEPELQTPGPAYGRDATLLQCCWRFGPPCIDGRSLCNHRLEAIN